MAHLNLAKLLAHKGKIDDAMGHYSEAIRLKPDDAVPHYDLGIIYNSRGNIPRAIEEFSTALKLKPTYSEAQRALNILNGTLRR